MSTVIARTVSRTVAPLILVTSIALLFQGHNLPGGGFIAGVLTVAGFVLLYIIYGQDYLEETVLPPGPTPDVDSVSHGIVEHYRTIFGLGLAVAVGSGLVPILFDEPFLSQTVWFFHALPLYGELEIASALAFDIGVYLVVVGSLLTIIGVVGEE